MCTAKTHKHHFTFITISTIVPNDTRIYVNIKFPRTINFRSPQNTDDQHCFSMPCLFVLISHFKPLTEIRTN